MGGEQVARPFVIILSFVALAGLLLTMFASYIVVGSVNKKSSDLPPEVLDLGMWDLEWFTPTTGYKITNLSVINEWPEGQTGSMTFDNGSSSVKYAYVVRDSKDYDEDSQKVWKQYTDYIGVKRKADDIKKSVFRACIPIQTFVDVFDPDTNTSRVDFTMGGGNYSFVLKLMDNNTKRIWWNNYTLRMGYSTIANSKTSMWAAIGMIMTGSIPNCNKILNYMIAVIVNFSLVFTLYVMISRVIPLIPGA